jgi:ATP-dependent RNA helicase HelY
VTAETFYDACAFSPDEFQREAINAIADGQSVVVTAPTGAGKTLIAEAAVHLALEEGGRAFYTTPIKALSNQKFQDLVEVYGEERVGLLTGDNSVNGRADVVVMTTEVLRNMIYASSPALEDLHTVILDEVHFLGDRSRGQVWEEVVIHAPSQLQLICLSATIANAREFADWISERRGATALIQEGHRPVPLTPMYGMKDKWSDGRITLTPLLREDQPNRQIQQQLAQRGARSKQSGVKRAQPKRFVTPRRSETLEAMASLEMLPAIYFIFSRAGCEEAAARVGAAQRQSLPSGFRDRIREIAERHTSELSAADLAALEYPLWLANLEAGVAAHHAGLVPAFKEAVEQMFEEGLLKVVFATETLALGINMPARSVVIENLSKFNGETHELLTASQYTQLTGRAGRRGIDDQGYGVILHSPYVRFSQVVSLAQQGASILVSTFAPTYNMAVNHVANYDQATAESLLDASFAAFQRPPDDGAAEHVARLSEEHADLLAAAKCEHGSVLDYVRDQRNGGQAGRLIMESLRPGDVIEIPGGARPGRYVLLRRLTGDRPRLELLSAGGKVAKIAIRDLVPGSCRIGVLHFKGAFRPNDKRFTQQAVQQLRKLRSTMSEDIGVSSEVEVDPVQACPRFEQHAKAARAALKLGKHLGQRELEQPRSLLDQFRSIVGLLQDRGYLDDWSLLPPGEGLRRLYSEQDLLLSECIGAGLFDDASSAEMAALLSAFVYEPRRDGPTGSMPTPDTVAVGKAVLETWQDLQQAERVRRLPPTRVPEFGFGSLAYAWVIGAELDDLLDMSSLTVGDFVRVCRQLLDVMRQCLDAMPHNAQVLSDAIDAVNRGIVRPGDTQ